MISSCTWSQTGHGSNTSAVTQAARITPIQEAFALGIAELVKEGAPLGRDGYRITIEPYGDSGWEMRYLHVPRKTSGDRLLRIHGKDVHVTPLF